VDKLDSSASVFVVRGTVIVVRGMVIVAAEGSSLVCLVQYRLRSAVLCLAYRRVVIAMCCCACDLWDDCGLEA
jgi:hypothetical protein